MSKERAWIMQFWDRRAALEERVVASGGGNPNRCSEGHNTGGRYTDADHSTCEIPGGESGTADTGSSIVREGPKDDSGKPMWTEDSSGNRWDQKGKPYPPAVGYAGDSWYKAHGILPAVADIDVDGKGHTLFAPVEQGNLPDDVKERYKQLDPSGASLRQIESITRQQDTLILERSAVDAEAEAVYGDIVPQSRPNKAIKLNEAAYSALETRAAQAAKRVEAYKELDGAGAKAIVDARVAAAAAKLEKTVNTTPAEAEEMARVEHQQAKESRKAVEDNLGKESVEAGDARITEKKAYRALVDARDFRTSAEKDVKNAKAAVDAAEAGGNPLKIKNAQKALTDAQEAASVAGGVAHEQRIRRAVDSFAYAQSAQAVVDKALAADPTGTTLAVTDKGPNKGLTLVERFQHEAESDLEDAEYAKADYATKYAFPPGVGTAARVALIPDAQNQANFREGKGRVYLVMEGNLKAAAVLSSLKESGELGEGSSVISVPSVTLWHTQPVTIENPDGTETKHPGELEYVAKKYLKGREVVLIPDADGINNELVVNQANALKAVLTKHTEGSGKVLLASPPLGASMSVEEARAGLEKAKASPIEKRHAAVKDAMKALANAEAGRGAIQKRSIENSPSGAKEELKGVDDYLGVGDGALGGLEVRQRIVDSDVESAIDKTVHELYADSKAKKVGEQIENTKSIMRAVALMSGDSGSLKTGLRSIAAASGVVYETARKTLIRLHDAGILTYVLPEGDSGRLTPSEKLWRGSFVDPEKTGTITLAPEHRSKAGPLQYLADLGGPGSGIRFVRTAEGAAFFGLPVGAKITSDQESKATAAGIQASGALVIAAAILAERVRRLIR